MQPTLEYRSSKVTQSFTEFFVVSTNLIVMWLYTLLESCVRVLNFYMGLLRSLVGFMGGGE